MDDMPEITFDAPSAALEFRELDIASKGRLRIFLKFCIRHVIDAKRLMLKDAREDIEKSRLTPFKEKQPQIMKHLIGAIQQYKWTTDILYLTTKTSVEEMEEFIDKHPAPAFKEKYIKLMNFMDANLNKEKEFMHAIQAYCEDRKNIVRLKFAEKITFKEGKFAQMFRTFKDRFTASRMFTALRRLRKLEGKRKMKEKYFSEVYSEFLKLNGDRRHVMEDMSILITSLLTTLLEYEERFKKASEKQYEELLLPESYYKHYEPEYKKFRKETYKVIEICLKNVGQTRGAVRDTKKTIEKIAA